MDKTYNLYGMGNALVDIVAEVDEAFFEQFKIEKGVMTLVDEARQAELVAAIDLLAADKQCGGSAANTTIGAAQFGARAFYSCKVADDDLGRFYLGDLRENGVHTNLSGRPLPPGITGQCLVMTTPDAERTMNTFLGITATYSIAEIDQEALADSQFLYMEGYLVTGADSREAMKAAKSYAESRGVKTALTFSDPAMVKYFGDGLREVIGTGVDLLFCNEEEATLFTGCTSLEQACEDLKRHAREFAITRGPQGALLWDGDRFIEVAPFPTRAVDTNGAGDLFAGAYLFGITSGYQRADAGKLASLASSRVVAKFGPRLTLDEARALLASL